MRLLIVTFDPPENVGGVEGRARNYTEQLLRKGHFVEILSLSSEYKDYSEGDFCGATIVKLRSSNTSLPFSLRVALKEISGNSIDTVFFLTGALTPFGVFLLLCTKLLKMRSAVFFYGKDILQAVQNRSSLFIELLISSYLAKRIVVNSNFTKTLLSRFFWRKVGVLYPATDPSVIEYAGNSEKKLGDDSTTHTKTVLFVGRLVKRKGADDLLRAFKLVVEKIPNSRLEIVGDGPELAALERLAEELGVRETVRFFGTLLGPRLYERYSMADVFAMPSKQMDGDVEGFGTVFLEAGLFEKASVGTFSGGIPEAVKNQETGLLVPEGDIRALASAIEVLLLDEELRESLGEAARDRVFSGFTWDKSTDSLLQIVLH